MAQAKVLKIVQIRFSSPLTLGRTAEVLDTIRAKDFRIDRFPIAIAFDVDSRFVRITVLSPEPFINLVPICNIGSMIVDEV